MIGKRKMLAKFFAAAFACAASSAGRAGEVVTNCWKGGNSTGGGWATAANWSAGVPVKGQVVKIDGGASVEMSNDDYATAKLASAFDIQDEGSTLYLPQAATAANTFAPVNLGEGTRLFIQGGKNTTINGLSGHGVVTNAFNTERILTIGVKGDTTLYEFAGRIDGKIGINSTGRLRLTGVESATSSRLVVLRNSDTHNGAPVCGTLDIMRFGTSGDSCSSIGKPPASSTGSVDIRYSGWLTYFGVGETTDRYFAFRYLKDGARAYPNTLDAGPNGGVTFTGTFELAKESGYAARMVLTGSNTSECVLAGPFKDGGDGTTHITKRGSGVWRFADNASRNNRNGFAVEEGTLRFDSIAEKGSVCSLGLATKLQKPYQGTYTADNDEDYAYLLGGATTNVVFEFTGSRYDGVTTRPIALKGKGGRLKSSSSSDCGGISFSGVSALEEGDAVKTLYLSGKNVAGQLGNVSDGKGRLGITKEDFGTWTLFGNQTFSGPLNVEAGKLIVARQRPYTWFKFIVRGVTGEVFYFNEIGLFDANGNRQNLGLKAVYDESLTLGAYGNNKLDWHELGFGEATIGTKSLIYYYAQDNLKMDCLFDGNVETCWRTAKTATSGIPNWDGNWVPIVMRLADGANEVSGCDVVSWSTQSITAFSLEGSCDGTTWVNLLEKRQGEFDYSKTKKWLSDLSAFPSADGKHIPAEGWRFVGHEPAAGSQLQNVSAVNVAPGATLKAVGQVALNCLTIDAARGNGVVDGFDFAEEGTLQVVSGSAGLRQFTAPLLLANLPEGALARLKKWKVAVNGVRTAASVSYADGVVTVTRPGGVIVLR